MITTLAKKELRAQAPFIGFAVFLAVLTLIDLLFISQPDLLGPRRALGDLASSGWSDAPLLRFLVLFALGSGLLLRDFEEGTMELLDALPVSRRALFLVKVGLGLAVVTFLALTDLGFAALRLHLSRSSLFPGIEGQVLAVGFVAALVQSVAFFALALALSFLRRYAWIAAGLLFWAWIALEHFVPALAALNPFRLTEPSFYGSTWVLPTRALAAALGASFVFGAVALFLFERTGDRLLPNIRGVSASKLQRVAGWGVGIATAVLGTSLATYVVLSGKPPIEPGTATYEGFGTARGRTARYVLTYPENLGRRAEALLARADATHDAVVAQLGVPAALTATIAVDATGSAAGTAGVARSSKIRLDLLASEDPAELAAVLGHETTHVYVDRLSNDRAAHPRWSAFFHEGFATWIEYSLFHDARALEQLHLTAAAIWARGGLGFDQVVDEEALAQRQDRGAVYPLGELFFERLIDRYGEDAPRRVFEALARPGVRQDLTGLERWRDAFQAAQVDLDVVAADWSAALGALVEARGGELAELPRLTALVEPSEDGAVRLSTTVAAPPGWVIVARTRLYPGAPDTALTLLRPEAPGAFTVARRQLAGGKGGYQLGYAEVGTNRVIWEPWTALKRD